MSPKTSDTDPIRVDFLPHDVVGLPGRIGTTIAPGKCHQGMAALWERDLAKDLDRLRDRYKTDVLVSLIEPHEFEALNIADLPLQAQMRSMKSLLFPIPDFSIPKSMPGLQELVSTILAAVRQGLTVVIHCKGGLGRSGLVAAACLVALGHSPEEAFAAIRRARSGSVETSAQEAYVHTFAQALRSEHPPA